MTHTSTTKSKFEGRVLYDSFIYAAHHKSEWRNHSNSEDPAYIVEVDSKCTDGLVTHLQRYKLRARCQIRLLDDWNVWNTPSAEKYIGCQDSRAPEMGSRVLVPSTRRPELNAQEGDTRDYHVKRYLNGIPEGREEISQGAALPMEHCIDYMGGIDLHKGCYIGQELTIRTYHTGVIRKRILPAVFYDPEQLPPETLVYHPSEILLPSPQTPIFKDSKPRQTPIFKDSKPGKTPIFKASKPGRNAGKFCNGIGNVGLVLARLEDMWCAADQKFHIHWADSNGASRIIGVKVFRPSWWPDGRGQT
ncbi:putative transferase CAF17, mitochondrial [Neolecta irregularis DAH-3]|uniref:Putative transferase CAF17, mitochondrial n=1 Tax=Neolecta irregularis (strain DAH-3) TaxID=1198029 RepID=A0A1U7LTP4_NEOID|nr:putative transferase CAF17, mitochondrial [Neolecta irregularis DAH-3]|eukprot:OLL26014.1 putative transferase CAF17, mitochondrial [Neolecta irregularis DAH-3]